jgi:4-hydroxymandelate oxidase
MKDDADQINPSEMNKDGVSRRDFFKKAAVIGGSVAAFQVLGKGGAYAQGAAKEATPKAAAPAGGKKSPLKLDDVLKVAREKLYPWCRVCPECDGVACAGEVPGFGGIGSGASFKNNYQSLASIHLNMRTFHANKKPDTSITVFGEKLGIPILAAATGGTTYNMGGKIGEDEYIDAILGGCLAGGSLGLVADGIGDPVSVYETRLKILRGYKGKGIAIIKPRTQEEIIKRIRLVESAGAIAVGIDIDSAGRAARALPGQTVEPKTPAQLRELVKATRLPFIIKGVMTPDEASMALDAGAAAIVVSNHGGRVLDHTPGVAQILVDVSGKVKGKMVIFADGAVRYGTDVLKLLALGADAVLVGRPLIRGAFGGGKDGVALMLAKMKNELVDSMVLTGMTSVRDVRKTIIA